MVSILKNVLYLFTITHFPIVTVTVIYGLVDRNIFLDLEHEKFKYDFVISDTSDVTYGVHQGPDFSKEAYYYFVITSSKIHHFNEDSNLVNIYSSLKIKLTHKY